MTHPLWIEFVFFLFLAATVRHFIFSFHMRIFLCCCLSGLDVFLFSLFPFFFVMFFFVSFSSAIYHFLKKSDQYWDHFSKKHRPFAAINIFTCKWFQLICRWIAGSLTTQISRRIQTQILCLCLTKNTWKSVI